jgi:hypothetical protein
LKPYYEHAGIEIYLGDCREILPQLPKGWCSNCAVQLADESILAIHLAAGHTVGPLCDLLLTDPPYGISYDASHSKYKNGIDRGEAIWDKEPFDPSALIALDLPTIMWGGNCFSSRLPDESSWISWVKIARQDADIRQSDCELAWTNCLGRSRVFMHLWIGAYRESESGMQNWHPCQKPIALMKWCMNLVKDVRAVLDPYMGSGTTLWAAKDTGRRAIGIEIEEKYCEIAAKRLSQEVFDFSEAGGKEI